MSTTNAVGEASLHGSDDWANGAACDQKAVSGSIPTATKMVRKLLDDVDGEFANRELLLCDAITEKFRARAHEMLDEVLDHLFDHSR